MDVVDQQYDHAGFGFLRQVHYELWIRLLFLNFLLDRVQLWLCLMRTHHSLKVIRMPYELLEWTEELKPPYLEAHEIGVSQLKCSIKSRLILSVYEGLHNLNYNLK